MAIYLIPYIYIYIFPIGPVWSPVRYMEKVPQSVVPKSFVEAASKNHPTPTLGSLHEFKNEFKNQFKNQFKNLFKNNIYPILPTLPNPPCPRRGHGGSGTWGIMGCIYCF